MGESAPYSLTEAGAVALRVTQLEHILRHFDRASMDLHHYVRAVDGLPTADEWQLIREQIKEMVDPYGPRNPNR
jgi:hypothetical protein